MLGLLKQLRGRDDKGFILVLVLWAMIVLALMAAGFSSAIRSHLHATASAGEIARAEAIADGGVNLALMDLVAARQNTNTARRFAADGTSNACRAAGQAELIIRIEDEAGKVNLNLANEGLLSTLFMGLGASADDAGGYANRILDFIDGDDDPRPNGAERADYAAAGSQLDAKNGPLDSADELEQVLGLPPDLITQVKAYTTVHSGLAGIDAAVASPRLLAALDAASLETATGGLDRVTSAFGDAGLPAKFAARSNQRAYTINVLARLTSGVQVVSQAVVEFPERRESRYVLHQWRRGSANGFDSPAAASGGDLPPC